MGPVPTALRLNRKFSPLTRPAPMTGRRGKQPSFAFMDPARRLAVKMDALQQPVADYLEPKEGQLTPEAFIDAVLGIVDTEETVREIKSVTADPSEPVQRCPPKAG